MRKFALVTAAAAALLTAPPAWADTVLFSTDFETGTPLPFTITGQVGINTGQNYIDIGGSGSQASADNHFASFGSGNNPSGTLESPSFTMLAGETYTLDAVWGEWSAGQAQEDFTVEVGPFTIVFSQPPTSNLDTLFGPLHAFFITNNTVTTTLRFHSSGGANVDSFLDNISFTTTAPVDNGVPEPSTWAMMLLGFGAIGFAMRRRKAVGGLGHA